MDERVTMVGSFKYTGPATNLNDENIIVLGHSKRSPIPEAAQRRIAGHAVAEFDRINTDLAQPA